MYYSYVLSPIPGGEAQRNLYQVSGLVPRLAACQMAPWHLGTRTQVSRSCLHEGRGWRGTLGSGRPGGTRRLRGICSAHSLVFFLPHTRHKESLL